MWQWLKNTIGSNTSKPKSKKSWRILHNSNKTTDELYDYITSDKKPEKKFDPRTRVGNLTDKEKMDQGFNGSTFSINGRDVDF